MKSKRPRDSQQSRVYAAEREFKKIHGYGAALRTKEDIQAYVFNLIQSNWFQSKFQGPKTVQVRVTKASRSRGAPRIGIKMCQHDLNEYMVLHELSHVYEPPGEAGHGREFCMRLLTLVKKKMGAASHDQLIECFRNAKVRYTPKRKSSVPKGTMPAGFAALQRWREEQRLAKAS